LSVIFGIDPGSRITGYGVVEDAGGGMRLLGFGQVKAGSSGSRAEKLKKIYDGLSSAIESWQPDVIVVESLYAGRNVQSALEASHARGVALLAAAESGAQVCEYSPSEIKRAVVGNGSATKGQVQFMVDRLLRPKDKPKADEADALAVAVCHLNRATGAGIE
jgi:crossover junction endodeoxyribonuclease RuvC